MCKYNTLKTITLAYPRKNSDRTRIFVDKCIAPLIQLLNKYKIHTLGCCCGHDKGEGGILIHPDSYRITEFGYCEIIIPKKEK